MITGQKDYVTPKQGLILKYNGRFELKKLFSSTKEWFVNNKYVFTEKEYKEKSGILGKEFRVEFVGERKIDEYASFNINLLFFLLDTKKMDSGYHGNVHLNATAYVLLDRKNKWQTNPVKAFLYFFYNNFIIKDKIVSIYEDKLYGELMSLVNGIKIYIKLR